MKLRHLLLASFAACTFASCSDDSSNGIEIPEENYQMIDANISLSSAALTGLSTKSRETKTEVGNDKELFINELTAYLFYADDNKFAAMKTVTSTNSIPVKKIDDIVVKVKATEVGELSDTQLKMVILANTKLASHPATLADLNASLGSVGDFGFENIHQPGSTKYLPMFSQLITIGGADNELLAGTDYDNWVIAGASSSIKHTKQANEGAGHPVVIYKDGEWEQDGTKTYYPDLTTDTNDNIPLTRHVARVQLQAIDCDFKNNYANASFELTDVYIANASNTSLIYADTEPYSLDNATAYSHGCSYHREDYFLVAGTMNEALHKEMDAGVDIAMTGHNHASNLNGDGSINYNGKSWFLFDDKTVNGDEAHKEMPQFYVFEMKGDKSMPSDSDKGDSPSGKIQTMLILRGNWYPNGKTEGLGNDVVKRDRYYRIPIKQDATSGVIGVQRNTIYKIYATITGEGSKDPDTSELNACISFSIKVEPWKVITQTEDDVN